MRSCPSSSTLESFVAAELGDSAAAAVAAHLEHCTRCQECADRLSDDDGLRRQYDRWRESSSSGLPKDRFHGHREKWYAAGDGPRPAPAAEPALLALPLTLADYRIVRQVGRGGMGVVYEAEQISLRRRVALKTLPLVGALDERQLRRFQQEARSAAALDHPNIVRVYSVGCEQGVHYYAMQYVEGQTLAASIDHARKTAVRRDRESFRQVARLGLQAAEALEHAHRMGVVHRDVKPSNLLVNAAGHLWVADFGLAQAEADPGLTKTGHILGTIPYMSPEQTQGEPGLLDQRTDVYSLGITLYECLTLRPAFGDHDAIRLLQRIPREEPPRPRQLDPAIPRDLETIVLKAIAKDPADRYPSARALGDDLRNFLECRPIFARRPGLLERAGKWSRRHGGLVAAAAAVLAVTTVALSFSTLIVSRAQRQTSDALDTARTKTEEAKRRAERVSQHLYASDMRLAAAAVKEQDWRQARQLLDRHLPRPGETDQRGFEWHWLDQSGRIDHQTLLSSGAPQYFVRFSPDETQIAAAGKDSVVRFFDSRTGEARLALPTGQGEVNGLAFSPEGQTLASAGDDGTVRLWDLGTQRETLRIKAHAKLAFQVAFALGGSLLVSCGDEPVIRLWDAKSGQPRGTLEGHTRSVEAIAVSPDGRWLASVGGGGTEGAADEGRWWDLLAKRPTKTFPQWYVKATCVAISRDARRMAIGGKHRAVRVVGLTDDYFVQLIMVDAVQGVCFSPDGSALVTADRGGVVRAWQLPANPGPYPGVNVSVASTTWSAHDDRAMSVAVSRDGRKIVSAGWDGKVKLWDSRQTPLRADVDLHLPELAVRALLPRRSLLAIFTSKRPDYLRFYDLSPLEAGRGAIADPLSGREPAPALARYFVLDSDIWHHASASRDEKLLAVSNQWGKVRVWDLDSRSVVREWKFGELAASPRFSADGEILAVVAARDESRQQDFIRLLSLCDDRPEERLEAPTCHGIAFSPDGTQLAASSGDDVVLFDWNTRQVSYVLRGSRGTANPFAYSPDGKLLAVASNDRQVRIWDAERGLPRELFAGHRDRIRALAFAPDGRSLVTGDERGVVKVWHVATGQELCRFHEGPASCEQVEFWPDGRRLFCRFRNETLRLFDWRSGGTP